MPGLEILSADAADLEVREQSEHVGISDKLREGKTMKLKKTKKLQEKINIKKTVKGLMTTDTGFIEHKFLVQLTKDDLGMTLSIDDYIIPLEPLGIEVRERQYLDWLIEEWSTGER